MTMFSLFSLLYSTSLLLPLLVLPVSADIYRSELDGNFCSLPGSGTYSCGERLNWLRSNGRFQGKQMDDEQAKQQLLLDCPTACGANASPTDPKNGALHFCDHDFTSEDLEDDLA